MKKRIFISCLLLIIAITIKAQEILVAIQNGDLPNVKKHVEKDPQLVNARMTNSYTPLLFAADNNKKEIAEYLLSKGAHIDEVFLPHYGYTPMIYGIKNGNVEMIKMLHKRGANIQYRTNLGENYLHFAAAHDRIDIAAYLIDLGIDVNSVKKGVYENSPLPAKDGTLYFSAFGPGTKGAGIYKATFINGKYAERQSLDGLFDSDISDACMDMEYIIFHTPYRKRTYGTELFICFHRPDGIWTRPVYMGDKLHQGHASNFGMKSPDGKYFFFLQDISLYWVDARIIDKLKPNE